MSKLRDISFDSAEMGAERIASGHIRHQNQKNLIFLGAELGSQFFDSPAIKAALRNAGREARSATETEDPLEKAVAALICELGQIALSEAIKTDHTRGQ